MDFTVKSSGEIVYLVYNDGTGAICSVPVNGTTAFYPDMIDGVRITSIVYPLPDYQGVTEVYLSDGIETLPDSFLEGNQNVETVHWPAFSKIIPVACFKNCEKLKAVSNIDKVTTISNEAFKNSGIEEIDLSHTDITDIGASAFEGSQLKRIIWPPKCPDIPMSCFRRSHLSAIDKIDNVCEIWSAAFSNTQFSEFDLSRTKMSLCGDNVFSYCFNLNKVTWSSLCDEIPDNCFEGSSISQIDNIDNIEYIGTSAFSSTKLRSIDISKTDISMMGESVFRGCQQLKKVVWNDKCTEIPPYCFCWSGITSFENGQNVTKIGSCAFSNSCFEHLNIGEIFPRIEQIRTGAFCNCAHLKSVVWPGAIHEISDNMFTECTELTEIKNLDNVLRVGKYVFSKTGFVDLDLSATSIIFMHPTCLKDCKKLKNLVLPYYIPSNEFDNVL